MKIHILADNRVSSPEFESEHGLSLFIEGGENILFDTGQSGLYMRNAARMGVAVSEAKHIVLSHGHYDHCGGLPFFSGGKGMAAVYINQGAFGKRYSLHGGRHEVGIPWRREEMARFKDRLVLTGMHTVAAPGVHILGGIPRTNDFEDAPEGFIVEKRGQEISDLLEDEQALAIETKRGIAVFLGCSHPGVINCLCYVKRIFPGQKIYSVVGGMHLADVDTGRIRKTALQLAEMDVEVAAPLHCTGTGAVFEIKRVLKKRCAVLGAGDALTL